MLKKISFLVTTLLAAALPVSGLAQPVIPGGVGFGTQTPAGRGGDIIRVTNLNASGAGSLQACVAASGPRTCVFEVSGTIRLTTMLSVENPYLTIAGQTAPAPGIMIRGAGLAIRASNVLVQHIAVRPGDDPEGPTLHSRDALRILGTHGPVRNVVIDHCSFSWAIDETVDVWGEEWDNVTFSHSIFSEALRDAPEEAGNDQGYGVLVDATAGHIAFIGNLFAHTKARNPRTAAANFVFVNNVVYNPGNFTMMLYNRHEVRSNNTIFNNVFIKGPDSRQSLPVLLTGPDDGAGWNSILAGTRVYLANNFAVEATKDPWSIVLNNSPVSRSELEVLAPLSLLSLADTAMTARDAILDSLGANAGTRPGERNKVDQRVMDGVRNGTGRIINCVAPDGSTRCQKNAGGWPDLARNTRRLTVPEDPHGDDDDDGYTNAEEWLHAMALQVEGRVEGPGEPNPTEPPQPARPKPPHIAD